MMMTSMIGATAGSGFAGEVRWLDLAAFAAMGLLWLFFLAMFFAIYKVLRSKSRGDRGWGDSPGL
jgi:hypothetical protein